jgi:hypothetical protein
MDVLSSEGLQKKGEPAPGTVLSLLNAKLLDEIKKQALLSGGSSREPPLSYVAEPLHVYMTVSNLRGIPFKVASGNSDYGKQTHGDRVHYATVGSALPMGGVTPG